MSRIWDDLPAWKEYRARLDDAEDRRREMLRQSVAAGTAHRDALARHAEAVAQAVATGGPVPDDEPAPSESHRAAVLLADAEVAGIRNERSAVLARVADDVEAAARDRWARRRKATAEAVRALTRAVEDTNSDLRDVAEARQAADLVAGLVVHPSRSARTKTHVTVGDLVDLAEHGDDPFALRDLREFGLTPVERDHGTDPALVRRR